MCVRGWALGKMEALLVQAPSDLQQNRVLCLCLTPHPLPPCLSSLSPSLLPSLPPPPPSCSNIEAIWYTHSCRYWDGKRCWKKYQGEGDGQFFQGAQGLVGKQDLQTRPLQAGLGRCPPGPRAEEGAPSSAQGSEGQAWDTAKHRAFPKPSTTQILCRRPS